MKRYICLLGFTSLALLPAGCGPGFPIVTAEQEQLMANVDTLMKENVTLKKRVSALESGDSAQQEIEELKFTIADANNRIEDIRREFSFVQGTIQEFDHDKSQLAEDTSALKATVNSISERIAGLEKSAQDMIDSFKAYERKAADGGAAGDRLSESISEIEKRLVELETRLGVVEAKLATEARRPAPSEDPEALYHRAYQQAIDKDYAKAEENFRNFLKKYPKHKFSDHAQYWLGEIYYTKGDWERAILEFDKVIKNYPKGDKAVAALLKQGFSFDKLGATKEARVLLEQVVEKYPKTPEADLARKRLKAITPEKPKERKQ